MTTALDYLGTGDAAYAFDVNNSGIACGKSRSSPGGAFHACTWDTGTGAVTALTEFSGATTSEAFAIADDGTVVGWSDASGVAGSAHTATKWTDPSTPVDLGGLTGFEESEAWDISNGTGDITGYSNDDTFGAPKWAVLWSPTITAIGSSGSFGRGTNATDDVVGYISAGGDPAIWPGGTSETALSLPGGASSGRAEDINSYSGSSDIVGWDDLNDALHWIDAGTSLTVLDNLPGGSSAFAYAVNASADIVGTADAGDSNFHGVLWVGVGAQELDSLPGATDAGAQGINDSQVIVGYSNDGSQYHAVVFTITAIDGAAASDGYWG